MGQIYFFLPFCYIKVTVELLWKVCHAFFFLLFKSILCVDFVPMVMNQVNHNYNFATKYFWALYIVCIKL